MPNLTTGSAWKGMWKGFLIAITGSFILLQVLSLGNLSYLYATQFHGSRRIHNFKILYVNYDGGVIGQSVLNAYSQLEGDGFPTLQPSPVQRFPSVSDVRQAICSGIYWSAIYFNPGGSDNLSSALRTGSGDLNSLTYVWNGVRYPAFAQSAIYSNLMTLIQATKSAYYAANASSNLQSADLSNPAVIKILFDPIHATEINVKSITNGTRILYNTISMVMPMLQQFFLMMALSGISLEFRVFSLLTPLGNNLVPLCVSVSYTLVGAMCMTAYIWAFREDWDVNGNQFMLTWMVVWLYMQINFLTVDILTTFVPMKFMPFCILTWIISSVASTIASFEMSPAFFRWGYALLAHETYDTLVTIWSGGCYNKLHRTLPIMFAWWIIGLVIVVFATNYRCNMAVKADKNRDEDDSSNLSVSKEQGSTHALHPDGTSHGPIGPPATSDNNLPRKRREASVSVLEDRAYGPRYPNPFEGLERLNSI